MDRRARIATWTIFLTAGAGFLVAGVTVFLQQALSVEAITWGLVFLASAVVIPTICPRIMRRYYE
jgi:Na+/melibiose symporter-like transporter